MNAPYYATVSDGQAIYQCVYDSELGFMCGKCRSLLGFRPAQAEVCKCGARVEEAMYPAKKAQPSQLPDAGMRPVQASVRGLRGISNARENRNQ